LLDYREEHLTLCPHHPLWVDVEAFEEAASTARKEKEPAAYRAAIDLYAGELLPTDRYQEWVEERRRELRESFLSLLVELASLCEGRGEYEAAVEALARTVANEPAHEHAHLGLMRLYARSGRPAESLRPRDAPAARGGLACYRPATRRPPASGVAQQRRGSHSKSDCPPRTTRTVLPA
jgi:DNA-binding SARP family transcriptional activator